MPRHLIIGNGKLGKQLHLDLARAGEEVYILTRSNGFFWPNPAGILPVLGIKPDVVWCTVGAGSVDQCEKDYTNALNLHVGLPVALMRGLPHDCGLVLCSTDYVASEPLNQIPNEIVNCPRSLYAMSKFTMEQHFGLISRKNTVCVRFGNLYTIKAPEQSFPGKVIMAAKKTKIASVFENEVTPTPVEWLSMVMIKNIISMFAFTPKKVHIAPAGCVRLDEWAKLFLPESVRVIGKGFDMSRPLKSEIGCSVFPVANWKDLWAYYGANFRAIAQDMIEGGK